MRKLLAICGVAVALWAVPLAFAGEVICPIHDYAVCTFTGETAVGPVGGLFELYRCSCGDEYWVRTS